MGNKVPDYMILGSHFNFITCSSLPFAFMITIFCSTRIVVESISFLLTLSANIFAPSFEMEKNWKK
jgi:hypothetical protein